MRRCIKNVLLVALFCAVGQSNAAAQDCDQVAGNKAAGDGRLEEAFEKLSACEGYSEATGETLGILAVLYALPPFGSFPSTKERTNKVYDLLHRAAKKGNYQALITLSSVYETGDPLVGIQPRVSITDCLLAVADNLADFSPDSVDYCVGQGR